MPQAGQRMPNIATDVQGGNPNCWCVPYPTGLGSRARATANNASTNSMATTAQTLPERLARIIHSQNGSSKFLFGGLLLEVNVQGLLRECQSADGATLPRDGIEIDPSTMQSHGSRAHLKRGGRAVQSRSHYRFDLSSKDTVHGTGHSYVALKSCSGRHDMFIGRGYMGVRSQYG